MQRFYFAIVSLISFTFIKNEFFLSGYSQRQLSVLNSKLPIPSIIDSTSGGEGLNIKCFWVNKHKEIFSLANLQQKKEDRIWNRNDTLIYYNFCQNTVARCVNNNFQIDQKETNETDANEDKQESFNSTMIYVYQSNQTCVKLTGDIDYEGSKAKVNKNIWAQFKETIVKENQTQNESRRNLEESKTEETETKTGLIITFAEGETCLANTSQKYVVEYKIYCNKNTTFNLDFSTFNISNCTNQIIGEGPEACADGLEYLLTQFIEKNKIIITLVFVIIGIFFILFGNRIFSLTLSLVCGLSLTTVVSLIIFSNFGHIFSSVNIVWFVVIGLFVLGLILGCILSKFIKTSCILVGGVVGFVLASFLYQIIIQFVKYDPTTMEYIIYALCILFGVFLGYKMQELIKTIATSAIGAFVIIRGLGFLIGGFPDTEILADIIKHKEFDLLEEYVSLFVLLYFIGFVGLFIFGIWFQCKGEKKSNSKDYKAQK